MSVNISEEDLKTLLGDIKCYLHITWEDEITNKNLTGMIKRGMAYLQDIAGMPTLVFTEEDIEKSLLIDYCRYANSQALEMFEKNFQSDLLSLHLKYQAVTIEDTTEVIS